jgi:circadian clock protein KaiB
MSRVVLQLYVSGQTQRSLRAAANLRRLCEQYLEDGYELTLIDVHDQPELAEAANILATPATVRISPPPASRIVGDLSDPLKVLPALGIDAAGADGADAMRQKDD